MNDHHMHVGMGGISAALPDDAVAASFTRYSRSFIAKFVREGRYHLIPLYYLLRLSDFAREGMENSGSHRFADHMYRNVASGRAWIGRYLDRLLLNLPATRSMRQRCFESRDAMLRGFNEHIASGAAESFRVLTVPCGIPRDVREFADQAALKAPDLLDRIDYMGIDLNPEAIDAARQLLDNSGIRNSRLIVADALRAECYPSRQANFIASTGFGEFLDDYTLATFYQNVFDALAPGGTFFTSAAARRCASDRLLRTFEFDIHYRTRTEMERLFALLPWKSIEFTHDRAGLQTFVRAIKR